MDALRYVTVFMEFARHRLICLTRILSQRRMSHMANSIIAPDGFTLHTENTSHILLPSNNEAFLNPVQEFNRDLSVAAIRVWSEGLNKTKEERWRQARERRLMKAEKSSASDRKRRKVEENVAQDA